MAYVVALDQGTTSSRAMVFDAAGEVYGIAQREFGQHFPQSGWVEHDASEIWDTQLAVAAASITSAGVDVAALGITNQRETTVLWDRATGMPVAPAIVWQDRRTAGFCKQLVADGMADAIRDKTGLEVDAYFSGTKLRWLLDNVEGARARAARGELAFGTVDSWLVWKLTNGQAHVTDVSNASRTMLFNIHTLGWDEDLLEALGVPREVLPEVKSSSEVYGETACEGLPAGIPIAGMAGDQQAALFGQQCTRPGMLKNTYGTGCFILLNTGDKPMPSRNRLLTTVAWRRNGRTDYALEGSIFIGGAVVQWLRDGLGIIRESAEVESLAASVPDSGGVSVVPAFTGLGAPHWDAHARGLICGLSRGSTAAHIARAALESIALQVADVIDAMRSDCGLTLEELRVDGGASVNALLMQFQADVLGIPIVRAQTAETTALGAAYLAGLGANIWKPDQIASQWRAAQTFEPQMPEDRRREVIAAWRAAVDRTLTG